MNRKITNWNNYENRHCKKEQTHNFLSVKIFLRDERLKRIKFTNLKFKFTKKLQKDETKIKGQREN